MTAAKEITKDSIIKKKVWVVVAAVVSARAQCLLFGNKGDKSALCSPQLVLHRPLSPHTTVATLYSHEISIMHE